MTKIAVFAFLLLLSCCLHWQGGMSQEDLGSVEENEWGEESVDVGGTDGGEENEDDGTEVGNDDMGENASNNNDVNDDNNEENEDGNNDDNNNDGENKNGNDSGKEEEGNLALFQDLALPINKTVTKVPIIPLCFPLVIRCAPGWSRMRDSRGCYRCYYTGNCRRYGCPRGYYCRASPYLSLPAYTCVRRLRCPRISKPFFPPRNVCLRCQKSCNCMRCRPGYVCCRDWFGCVKCVRGIPY